jgi:two-component system, sensor histidine kinase YesM
MKSVISYFRRMTNKLAFKIPLVYFLITVLTVSVSLTLLSRIASESAQKKVNEASFQTINSIQSNVNFMIENVDNYSKIVLSDSNLQNLLRQGNIYSNLPLQSKVSHYMYDLIQAEPFIESIYIFDNSGDLFSTGQSTPLTFKKTDVKEAAWYKDALSRKGKYILRLNGSNEFSGNKNGNFVSLIRLIRDVNNVKQLGVMVINIPENALLQFNSNAKDENPPQVLILDENNHIISPSSSTSESINLFRQMLAQNEGGIRESLKKPGPDYIPLNNGPHKYIASYLTDPETGWKYINIISADISDTQNKSLLFLSFVLLLVNGIVFFVSSFFISRNTITPIHQLLQSMKHVNQGEFCEVKTHPKSDEFERLFNGYNIMIRQIHQLVDKIIQEQKTIRKAELNALQAQIKPHFLYNTLDSIASLALAGDSEQVCYLVESLGSYYRTSVSKGQEVITIREEIGMVRSYLNIQRVRYPDLFQTIYDVEDSCLDYPILKLVLQPLVENSLYHGIREKGTSGIITISAHELEDSILLSVADNGVGMSEDKIEAILKQERSGQVKSFGLWGTMERIRIFYGRNDCFKIESTPGKGTKITLTIPKGENDDG